MSEPTVSYPVREVLARIEGNVAALQADVHAIQLTLAAGSATVVAQKADAAVLRARLALAVAALAAVAAIVAGLTACQPPGAAPPSSLHSVWCVKRGYPADLALPVVVGPGTGLSGCPAGERQVSPQ